MKLPQNYLDKFKKQATTQTTGVNLIRNRKKQLRRKDGKPPEPQHVRKARPGDTEARAEPVRTYLCFHVSEILHKPPITSLIKNQFKIMKVNFSDQNSIKSET